MRRSWDRGPRFLLGVWGSGILVGGCIRGFEDGNAREAGRPTAEARHWVQSDRLRQIMDNVDRLSVSQWPQEVQTELAADEQYHAAKAFWEARQLASGLAQASVSIPTAVKNVKMSEVDRRSFLSQAETLGDQAKRLRQAASLGDREAMRRALADIDDTCTSCHSRFRDLSGDVPRR